jgi:hypothetical protein
MKINPSATPTFHGVHDIPRSDGLESYVMQNDSDPAEKRRKKF